jgi:hypothetical protein
VAIGHGCSPLRNDAPGGSAGDQPAALKRSSYRIAN